MDLSFLEILGLVIIGCFVGFGASMFGLGGGVLIAPLLPNVLNLPTREVVVVSLATVLCVVGTNVYRFTKSGLIDWPKALIFAPFAAVGGVIAAYSSTYIDPLLIRIFTGGILIFLGVRLLMPKRVGAKQMGTWFIKLISTFAGFGSGLTGVGTGAVLSPVFLREKIVEPHRVSPTLNAILFFTTILALGTYIVRSLQGSGVELNLMQLQAILIMGAVAQVTGYFGRQWQLGLPEALRKRILSVIITLLGISVFLRMYLA